MLFFGRKLRLQSIVTQKIILCCCFIFGAQTISAIENASFSVQQIQANNWQLEGAKLSLSEIARSGVDKESPQLRLSINRLKLPEPFDWLKFMNVKCQSFEWQENYIVCHKGTANFQSKLFRSTSFNFFFSITPQRSSFTIQHLKIASGSITFSARQEENNWHASIQSKGIQLKKLKQLLVKTEANNIEVSSGRINTNIQLAGNDTGLHRVHIKSLVKALSLQANEGQFASESLNIEQELMAEFTNGKWRWRNDNQVKQGEVYFSPVYIEIKNDPISVTSKGVQDKQGRFHVSQTQLTHPGIYQLDFDGMINKLSPLSIDSANAVLNITDLEKFSLQYLAPFMEQTAFEGIKTTGRLNSAVTLKGSKITQLSADFSRLFIQDDNNKFSLKNAKGAVYWSTALNFSTPSMFAWDEISISGIPVEAGQIKILLKNKSAELLEQASIPLLGGLFEINQFNWHHQKNDEPKVFFEAGIKHVSLEKLSSALNWTPLTGEISGYIPAVDYNNKTLIANGGLTVKLFDGTINITKLASSGLLTDFSRFYMDMEIDNLDLNALTQKFKMGHMEGRVSGFINNLYLENWEPVTFYAWIGTPENDDSRHRISQKAVENIASIGGGGAADVISKGFLRFFDTFGYEQLGFGCYLHQGVCQLMGVEAAEQGYYIIKGGGLPRIDIIGYNPQVDWKVLINRLSRITTSNEVVIQ